MDIFQHDLRIQRYCFKNWLEGTDQDAAQDGGASWLYNEMRFQKCFTVYNHMLLDRTDEWLIKTSFRISSACLFQCQPHNCYDTVLWWLSNGPTTVSGHAKADTGQYENRNGHEKSTKLNSYTFLLHVENATFWVILESVPCFYWRAHFF